MALLIEGEKSLGGCGGMNLSKLSRLKSLEHEDPTQLIGIVRVAWPHNDAALQRGHTLKTVHSRLLEDGLRISYGLLASYVNRLRREVSSRELCPPTATHTREKDSVVSEPDCTAGSK